MEPARITITRKDPRDIQDRQIIASVDGERFATLLFGEEASREVAPGPHRLRVHNTLFWKTIDLDLRPGEHSRFLVINHAGPGSLSMLGLLGAGPLFLKVERVAD